MVPGSWDGAGGICFFLNTFFFRSLALVFQKSPTRNKEATRFTLMIGRGRSGRDSINLQRGHTTFSVSR